MAILPVETRSTNATIAPVSLVQKQRTALNVSILEATELQLSAKDNPQALTLRAVIDELNTILEADVGPNAIDVAVESGLDVSPDATAERIVHLSTAFFPAFLESNPGETGDEALSHFVDVIRGGIEQGFADAREILDGLKVLEGTIASDIDLTYNLVQEKLDAFQQRMSDTKDVVSL